MALSVPSLHARQGGLSLLTRSLQHGPAAGLPRGRELSAPSTECVLTDACGISVASCDSRWLSGVTCLTEMTVPRHSAWNKVGAQPISASFLPLKCIDGNEWKQLDVRCLEKEESEHRESCPHGGRRHKPNKDGKTRKACPLRTGSAPFTPGSKNLYHLLNSYFLSNPGQRGGHAAHRPSRSGAGACAGTGGTGVTAATPQAATATPEAVPADSGRGAGLRS